MSKDLPQPKPTEELDLGQLFQLIGNAFNRFFKFIGSILKSIFLAFVWLVFFVKRQFLKLLIAVIAGVILGFVFMAYFGPTYKSFVVVKQNYKTGENLNNLIGYFNALIAEDDILALSNALGGIDSLTTSSIKAFQIISVSDKNQLLKNYDAYLKEIDSVLASTIDYSIFLANDKVFNHKFQKLTIKAKKGINFESVFEEIVNKINTNEYFLREQRKDTIELNNRIIALERALVKSDSLQNTYKRVLEMSPEEGSSQTSVTIKNSEDLNKTREFELYKNDIEIQRELIELERQKENRKYILEIISSRHEAPTVDNTKVLLGLQLHLKYYFAVLFFLLTLLFLLGKQFIIYLDKFKDKTE